MRHYRQVKSGKFNSSFSSFMIGSPDPEANDKFRSRDLTLQRQRESDHFHVDEFQRIKKKKTDKTMARSFRKWPKG